MVNVPLDHHLGVLMAPQEDTQPRREVATVQQ